MSGVRTSRHHDAPWHLHDRWAAVCCGIILICASPWPRVVSWIFSTCCCQQTSPSSKGTSWTSAFNWRLSATRHPCYSCHQGPLSSVLLARWQSKMSLSWWVPVVWFKTDLPFPLASNHTHTPCESSTMFHWYVWQCFVNQGFAGFTGFWYGFSRWKQVFLEALGVEMQNERRILPFLISLDNSCSQGWQGF